MSPVSATCPACGSPLVFGIDTSLVTVCKACDSIVARTDKALKDLGKVASLTATGAALEVGMTGRYENKRFTLTGRTQLQHELGGVWDEWYAAFDDGRWGWLAEAQGRYYLSFEAAKPEAQIKGWESLEIGKPIAKLSQRGAWYVAERGVAVAVSAEGELPFRLAPGAQYAYADLTGPAGAFGSIDYSEAQPRAFYGRKVTLADLGIKAKDVARAASRQVEAAQVSCPNCGAQLRLRAPGQSERVVCPSCDSLLDAREGNLKFLESLKQPKIKIFIPLGSKGTLGGLPYTVVGVMERSVHYEGKRYPWQEYLLYNTDAGFRWLVGAEGHWSFGEPIDLADVTPGPYGKSARAANVTHRLFQDGKPRVDAVYGEFYWAVRHGETVQSADYIAPPHMLSSEIATYASGGGEINWSRLSYVDVDTVKKAFGLQELPKPQGVAPNQPFPHKAVYKYWRRFAAALFALWLVLSLAAEDRQVLNQELSFSPVSAADGTQVWFSEPFELKKGVIEVKLFAPVQNTWIYAQGDFVNEETGLVQEFDAGLEYYEGVDDGESWSEGSRSKYEYLAPLPPGRYTLRIEAQWERFSQPASLTVQVKQDVTQAVHFFLAFLALGLLPFITLIRNYSFDVKRWSTSDYSPYSS